MSRVPGSPRESCSNTLAASSRPSSEQEWDVNTSTESCSWFSVRPEDTILKSALLLTPSPTFAGDLLALVVEVETVVVAVVGVVTVVEAATAMVVIAVAATRAGAEVTGVVAAGGVGVLEVAVVVVVVDVLEVATVVEEALLPELDCVSDTLFSGRAIEMRERSLRSFSVKSELRRMTGCDNMFMSCPSGEASRLYGELSPSLPVLTGTDFTEFLPFRLTFMLSSFTSKSQKSVQMPLLLDCDEHGLQACLLPLSRSLSQFVSLVRCCVKWLGNTLAN